MAPNLQPLLGGSGDLQPDYSCTSSVSSITLVTKVRELIVEARKLEHQYPHALNVEHRGS